MKERTSIALEPGVRRAAQAAARRRGVSLSRFVGELLEAHLADEPAAKRFPRSAILKTSGRPLALEHDRFACREGRGR